MANLRNDARPRAKGSTTTGPRYRGPSTTNQTDRREEGLRAPKGSLRRVSPRKKQRSIRRFLPGTGCSVDDTVSSARHARVPRRSRGGQWRFQTDA